MFTAMILACWLHSPNDCTQFTDKRGPYLDKGECGTRGVGMIGERRTITAGMIIVGAHRATGPQEST